MITVNLADLPDAMIDSLNKYGTLKATLLAMRNVRNKRFLKKHFEEIFVFLQKYPEKTDLQSQLATYLLAPGLFTDDEIQELIDNIFSPILKQEVMGAQKGFIAVAYRNGKAEAEAKMEGKVKKEAEKAEKAEKALEFQRRSTVMRSWHKGLALDAIIYISNLPPDETTRLIAIFDEIKAYFQSKTDIDMAELKKLSDLNDAELKALVELLKQQ